MENSLVWRSIAALQRYYKWSLTDRLWTCFCGVENRVANSLYGRFMDRLRILFFALGDILRDSYFYRGVCWLRDFYFKLIKGSLVFGWIQKLSLHQWFLVAFALYLPIEYTIRNVLALSFLSAVWEEAFILVALILLLWRLSLRQTDALGRETPLDGYMLLFMAMGLFLMSIISPNPGVAFAGYRAVVEYMIWFFILIRLVEDNKDFKVVYYTFLGMATLLCLHGVYQYVIAVPIPASWVTQTEIGVRTRVFSDGCRNDLLL